MKKFSFVIGSIGAILGIISNIYIIYLPAIGKNFKMFTIAAIIFSVVALFGALMSNRFKNVGIVMMFLGVISNIPVSVTSGINNIIMTCILCVLAIVMLLTAGIIQVVK